MRLIKDLIIIDFETEGERAEQITLLQLSAVRLSKETLLDMSYFNQYIRSSFIDSTLSRQAQMLGTNLETLKKAPKCQDALVDLVETFSGSAMLSFPTYWHYSVFLAQLKRYNIRVALDPHIMDLWTIYYENSLRIGLKVLPSAYTLTDHYRIKVERDSNNSFIRAKLHAELLRKLWLIK